MRTTIGLLSVALAGCTDQAPADRELLDRDAQAGGPHVCAVLEESGEDTPRDPALRLPGPRQPRGGMPELPAPADPTDPRDACVLTNRCLLRTTSGGLDWRAHVEAGVLVVGYLDDRAGWLTTTVDPVPADAIAYLYPDDDGVRLRVEEPLKTSGYRLCVDR